MIHHCGVCGLIRCGGLAIVLLMFVAGCPGPVGTNGNGTPPDNTNGNGGGNGGGSVNDNVTPPPVDDDGILDSDGDGFSDDEEITRTPGTDPQDPTDNPNNVRDSDGDGCSDFDETHFVGFCDGDPNTPPGDVTPPDTTGDGLVSISGGLQISSTSLIDGDNNDPTNPVIPNEGVDTQQDLPNPCTLGGYLGDTRQGLDTSDVYRVQMDAGQTATLFLASPNSNDFDLFLFAENGGPALDSSEGTGQAEAVTAPSNGTFLVEVFGFSVADSADPGGLYTLLVGDNALGATNQAAYVRERLSSLDEFMEGEVIVKHTAANEGGRQAKVRQQVGMTPIDDGARAGGFARMAIDGSPRFAKVAGATRFAKVGGLQRPSSPTIEAIKRLRRQADVETAEPNYIRRPTLIPNDEFFPFQWHYPQINVPEAWDITTGDIDAIVAVIDTGVVLSHPDLQGQLFDGFDFISEPENALDGDGIDANPDDPGDQTLPGGQSTFHGTHVAGTVAARTNNNFGVAGVAFDSRVMPIRVLGRVGGLDSDIVQGIRYCVGLSNNSGTIPIKTAEVINMSLGGPGFSSAEQAAITAARSAGAIVVVAAGNEASNAAFFSPAGLDGVITVSAVGLTRELAPYSNFGGTIEVAAPGGNLNVDANADTLADGVLSTVGDDGSGLFSLSQGTSMAAPHVAGVISLMKAVNRGMTPSDFDRLLARTHPATSIAITDDLGVGGRDDSFGFGLINAVGAVRAAQEIIGLSTVESPILQVVPRNLDFGSDLTSAILQISNAGIGALTISAAVGNQNWITVTPSQGSTGPYTVTVNRSGLPDGVYSGIVQLASNGGNTAVTIRMVVGEQAGTGGDIGTVYVLLVDPDTFEPIAQDNIRAEDGYEFFMPVVPEGEYVLFAGTDLDDDSFLGDEGEAFGAYPTLLDPAILDATRNRTGLSMSISLGINIQSPGAQSAGGFKEGRPLLRRMDVKVPK